MNLDNGAKQSFLRIPEELKYIFILFLVSRTALTIIGLVSRLLLDRTGIYSPDWVYSKHLWLDVWGWGDTGWYLSCAIQGYPAVLQEGVGNYGFFPLYPLCIKILGMVIADYYYAGLIISNVCLLISCLFLYKLVKADSDHDEALRSVKYLFLFPASFIFSGVFSESLFLMLVIVCFYCARKGDWLLAGIAGFLLSLTRPVGVFLFPIILLEYLEAKNYKIREIRLDILSSLLIPLGLLAFFGFCYFRCGNFFAYFQAKSAWEVATSNPVQLLYSGLFNPSINARFNACWTWFILMVLIVFCKKIKFAYLMWAVLLIFFPLTFGGRFALLGMIRFTSVIFPLFILCARIGASHPYVDQNLALFLALLQGFLMVFWATGGSWLVG